MSDALRGIRVIEYVDRCATLAGRILADLGAEVIMVEPPGGQTLRHEAPFLDDVPGVERGFGHLYFNINKSSVVLELADAAGRTQMERLVASADVLLTSRRLPAPLDYEHLRALQPGLIQCSVTPFGLDTPWRDRLANDLVAGAAGGLIQVSGSPQGTPIQGGADPSYTMTGLAAASAITMALQQRDFGDNRGVGVHIDLSMQEATALAVMQTASPGQWQWHQRIPRRPGLSAAMACKDGKYVSLLVRPDRFDSFLGWAEAVGIDHGMTQEDWHYARLDSPREGNPVSETTLKLAAALTRDEFVDGALGADIICLPVLDFPDLEQAEQYRVNDQFLHLVHPELAVELGLVRSPVDAMADGVDFDRAPLLGEHQHLLEGLPMLPEPQPQPDRAQHPERALAGLRVVDFGWVLAAPIGTRILASFGAEVIRVESATKPDSMRSQIGPDGKPDADMGGLYNVVNAGKKSLAIDLGTAAGMALIKELIATADIVVNNFRPGAMERMGLGYEVLKGIKPDIILLNLPGAHRAGPWASRPSMGNILMAASGFNMLTGFPDERPRGIGIAYPDFTSPHLLVSTLMAALRQRDRHGRGQELHLTQLSGVLSLLGAAWMAYKASGEQPPRNANRNPNFAPHGVYPARAETEPAIDAWLALAVQGEDQWQAFCRVIRQPGLVDDPRFASHSERKANEDALDAIVAAWSAQQDKWLAADLLQAAGVAAAPVEHLKDMLEVDPQLHRHYQQLRQPVADVDIPVDTEAARWVGQHHQMVRAPMMGEHNQYVVQEILGRSDEEFVQLLADGVLN
ncbi:MAG: CoA transferase [Pseudomonadota bacterium]